MGWPKKQIEVVLLTPKVEKPKGSTSKKVRGKYTNWFVPSLWDLIYVLVKQHKSFTHVLHYLQLKYKLSWEMKNIYENLSRGSLVEGFTWIGKLKHGIKQSIFKEITYIGGAQHVYILSKFLALEKEIIVVLKPHWDASQPLYVAIVWEMIKTFIQKRGLSYLITIITMDL